MKLNRVRSYEKLEKIFSSLWEYLEDAKENEVDIVKVCLPAALIELDKEEIEEAKSKFDIIAYGCENTMPLSQNL